MATDGDLTPNGEGTYVYGIVGADHPCRLDDLTGVGQSGAPLRRVDAGRVAAVVSDAPAGLRAKRRDLLAHHQVLQRLGEQGPVLPMRFGVVAPDEQELAAELRRDANQHLAALARVAGRVEMNVKLLLNEDALVREVALGDPAIQRLRATVTPDQEGQIALGEAVAAMVRRRADADAATVLNALRPHADQVSEGPQVSGCALNAGFLVDSAKVDEFTGQVKRLDAELGERADLRCTGPIPVYSFATTEA